MFKKLINWYRSTKRHVLFNLNDTCPFCGAHATTCRIHQRVGSLFCDEVLYNCGTVCVYKFGIRIHSIRGCEEEEAYGSDETSK